MKPNKYEALEFCRRAIKSCTELQQLRGANMLNRNFFVMFGDVASYHLLDNEWMLKFESLKAMEE